MRTKLLFAAASLFAVLTLASGSPTASAAADYDCSDFSTQSAAQDFFIAAGGPASDPHRLDADGDGIACESNPCPCGSGPPEPTTPVIPPAPPPEPAPVRSGVVLERVIDGDTLEVRFPDDSLASVRLIGIDTPEAYGASECGAEQASAAMARRVEPGQRLRLISDPSQDSVDYNGRLLRYVEIWASDRDLGLAQIQSGWAKLYVFEDDFKRVGAYRKAQRQTRKRARGVWSRCGGRIHQRSKRRSASAEFGLRGAAATGSHHQSMGHRAEAQTRSANAVEQMLW